ncbi:dihydroorotase [Clostridium cavendishii DSM 21758]|uniref:Dihydroorotase n=1 Tax=Clostridium cavendishii DSM 21758 TaxID=1121302 RepID=A0A1M6F3E0_9CLOT|nr:dihydroorotase [Clostridium cavendishii]SHI92228.1 dihydroorotase [Clostridium cavendishii DSM 21758]
MKLLLKNGHLVDYKTDFYGDIYIEDGFIKDMGKDLNYNVATVDLKGLTVMPAFIDTHAHFREPGFTYKEDIESGSKAAVKGGYTLVNLMANTMPICSTKEVLDTIRKRAREVGLVDIHQCISITKNFDGKTLSHLDSFRGDKSIKAISDDGKGVESDEIMRKAMEIASVNDIVIMSHAETSSFSKSDMRQAENTMTFRDVNLARETKARLHMAHVSTKEAMGYIIDGKKEGLSITAEVTPHHIGLTSDVSNYRVNPPIRPKEDRDFLIQAIKDGYVDTIGTDHAPHSEEDKKNNAPGMTGLELAFNICYTKLVLEGHISLNRLSELMSKRPAEILGANKGTLDLGKDGDLVIIDRDKEITIDRNSLVSKGKNTPFHGYKFKGEVVMTIRQGKIVYRVLEG